MAVDSKRQPTFYYDLGSVACYLAAERVMTALAIVPEWQPVLAADLGAAEPEPDWSVVARAIEERGLQPLRRPASWPPDSREAMLAATYAKHIGRAVAFSLACLRQVFAGGRDLGERDTVLIAGAACEMHPAAVIKGIGLRSVVSGLAEATCRAAETGVGRLPAIVVDGRVFQGEDAVERAARHLDVAA